MKLLTALFRRGVLVPLALVQCGLSACALSNAADDPTTPSADDASISSSTTVEESNRSIDWNRATSDAQSVTLTREVQRRDMSLAVPLLIPPSTITLSGFSSVDIEPVKILVDSHGYSSVSNASDFDILITASNRSYVNDERLMESLPDVFDGDYQAIQGGGEITIGRYGALYSIQVQCHNASQRLCGSERQIREIIEVLQVRVNQPNR